MARQAKGKKKISKKERFQLKGGDQLPQEEAPNIAGRGILLEGAVKSGDPDGVIIAQGGDAQGFALILDKGYLCYITCVDGKLSTVKTNAPLSSFNFAFSSAMSPSGNVTLSIDGKQVASGKVLPVKSMPIDGLAVSADPDGTVGDYETDYPLDGEIQLTLNLLPIAKKIKNTKADGKSPARVKTTGPLSPIVNNPRLPRVLLIGDSISIGYTVPTRELLKDQANVHRPPTNCASTKQGLEGINTWLGDHKWDVIHFNWGLHDLKYMGPSGENLADPDNPANAQQVSLDQYTQNLTKLVKRLKKTGAKLIWRNTTPVPEGAKGRVAGDAKKYNAAAAKIMSDQGIPTDDLYSFSIENWDKIGRKANVHFTPEGSKELAKRVARKILALLE
ncbi:MAG: SGNH/GDSL hydrolase family protein [Verrucomicrobiota bacterium]|nr:SGNH/GDSL hydrolase family protein [Verrucomicrobiota bacterium]